MTPLTVSQLRVYRAIVELHAEHGITPSITEVAARLGVRLHAVHVHLDLLRKVGLLVRVGPRTRARNLALPSLVSLARRDAAKLLRAIPKPPPKSADRPAEHGPAEYAVTVPK